MASLSSTGADAPGKVFPSSSTGLIAHPLLSASTQVQILSIIDATGSADLGDIIAELPHHLDPAGAVVAMVEAGILKFVLQGVLDASTTVSRRPHDSASTPGPVLDTQLDDPRAPEVATSRAADTVAAVPVATLSPLCRAAATLPTNVLRLDLGGLRPDVIVAPGHARRLFAEIDSLRQPGIYVLLGDDSIYVGMGGHVGARIASGAQPIQPVEVVAAIVDAAGGLTDVEARVCERILWSRAANCGQYRMVNTVPNGDVVSVERHGQLEAFVGQACLALHQQGVAFAEASARMVMAGPRSEPGRLAPMRPFNQVPEGDVFELLLGGSLVALAARQSDGRWILLRGSDVRVPVATSANASVNYLRGAWVHSGLLTLAADGQSFTVQRDLTFASGSAAAQFCGGSKAKGVSDWAPVDPTGGFDPKTAALIAH